MVYLVGNKLEQQILGVFCEDLTTPHSINNISKTLHKAYPYINKKINLYIKEGIINKIVIGNSFLCYLNLQNEKTRALLSLLEISNREKNVKNKNFKDLREKIEELKSSNIVHSSLLFKNNLIIVVENILGLEEIRQKLKLEYNLIILDRKSFQNQVLINNSVLKEKIIISNPEKYYEMLGEIQDKIIKIIK